MRDQHLANRGDLLQAAGQVDRIPHGGELLGYAYCPQQRRAGVDAYTQRHFKFEVRKMGQVGALELHAIPKTAAINAPVMDYLLHRQRGAHGPCGIIFTRLVSAPQCHDGIANVLIDLAAVRRHHPVQPLPRRVDQSPNILSVHLLGQRVEPREIREQHRHQLALLDARLLRLDLGQALAQR